jgi:NAD(P)-dependent dehydrogenase (short-subunit alcohol dehydrogenase family)
MGIRIKDAVVVITGASSGIGRATAIECARRGASVVVSARQQDALADLVKECEREGGRALAVTADVNDADAMKNLARQTVAKFGRIDAWFNNASVTLAGRFEESPPDVYRKVIETNLFGVINGTRAVLPYFREQGRGVLINHSSVLATFGASHFSAYAASKFAIKGFTESIRQELRDSGIDVCLVMPAAIDTPLYQHAANYSGRKVKPANPVYDAQSVAKTVVKLIERPRREAVVGNAGRIGAFLRARSPGGISDRMIAKQWETDHFDDEPADPSPGNVFEPDQSFNDISGGWQTEEQGGRSMMMAGLALAAIPATLLWRRRSRQQQKSGWLSNGRFDGLRSRVTPALAAVPVLARRRS